MEKKTAIALVAFLVCGVGAFFVLRSPEKGERSGPPPRPFPEVKSDGVTELDVTTDKGEHTHLVKQGGGWRIQPGDLGADPAAVKALVDAIANVKFGDLVTESAAKHDDLGVGDKAPRVTVKSGNQVAADFYVGKAVGGFTMIRPASKNEVWQATGIFQYQANRDLKGWRDKTIFDFTAASASKLTVENAGGKLVVEKEPAAKDAKPTDPAKWKIDESTGDAPKTVDALDVQQVSSCVQGLGALKANDFAEDKKPEEVGLAKPALTVTVEADGKPHTLLVGDTKGDDVYVKSAAGPTIWTVKKYAIDRVAHKPIDYRDKTIAKIKSDDIDAITIVFGGETLDLQHAGGKWTAKGKTVDENKVKQLAGAFENLSASSFADERDPAKNGLAKPTATVTVKAKKQTLALKIGSLVNAADYHVQKVGAPDVYLVKKWMVDRFLKKASDLQPAAATAAAPKKK